LDLVGHHTAYSFLTATPQPWATALPSKTPHFGASPAKFVTSPNFMQQVQLQSGNVLAKVFRPVSEVFLVGIMVGDFFGFWVPRVGNALKRGAFDYNPNTDPVLATKKTPWQRKQYIFWQRVKRLNWRNAFEETMREIASGPALFLFPTLVFSIATKLYGKSSIELSTPMLKQFAAALEAQPGDGAFKDRMKTFLNGFLGDEAFHNTAIEGTQETYGQFFKHWTNDFVDTVDGAKLARMNGSFNRAQRKAYREKLTHLQQQLEKTVIHYNREHHANTLFYQYETLPIRWLKKATHGAPVFETERTAVRPLFENLLRWKDFAFQVEKSWKKWPTQSLAIIIKRVRNKTTILKAGFTLTVYATTLSFLFHLVQWAQRYNHYEANRLIPLDKLKQPATTEAVTALATSNILPPQNRSDMAKSVRAAYEVMA